MFFFSEQICFNGIFELECHLLVANHMQEGADATWTNLFTRHFYSDSENGKEVIR